MMLSTVDDDSGKLLGTGAVRVGADLRAARLRLGWLLPDISAGLRIRLAYLEALEDGRTGDLPGPAYAVGFVRTYGAALGLDPDEISRRFRAEATDVNRRTELEFPAPVPERGVPAGAVVLLGVILAVGAYVGWYRLSGDGKLPAEVAPAVPAHLAPLAEQAVPPVAAPQPQSPALASPAGQTAEGNAGQTVVMPPSSAAAMSAPQLGQVPASTVSPAAPTVPPPPPAHSDDSRIVIRARANAWVQVKDKDKGQVILNRTFHAGESWTVPAKTGLLLTLGNAGATDIVVDGVVAPGFGTSGAVRRDLPLDPDLIKDGKLPGQVQAATPAADSLVPARVTAAPSAVSPAH